MNAPHPDGLEHQLSGRTVFVRETVRSEQPRRPAVMVHGLGGQSTNWTDFMAEMRGELDASALDLPGFGWSPPPADSDYSVAADVEVVTALIEKRVHETGERVDLFGNSMGGAISVFVAATRPDLVETLTLISPALPDLRPRRDTVGVPLVAIPGLGRQVYARLRGVPPERQVAGMVALNYGDAAKFTPERRAEAIREVQRRLALPYAGEALSGAARSLLMSFVDPSRRGLWAAARRVTCPTLVIYGGRDRLVDARRAHRVARHLRHAQIVTLPSVGHVAQMEDPALVARFVRRLLAARSETSESSETSPA
ncbi:MAG TPA: alpha/beta hydrolase [Actinomycetes bacterium]|nr:alpha/beta hydrolase [Actinomycetes bacterium]